MTAMPNVHIRDLPPEAVETLRDAAKRHGRSLNAEIVSVLVERAEQEAQRSTLAERLEAARQEWRRMNPDGFPPGSSPRRSSAKPVTAAEIVLDASALVRGLLRESEDAVEIISHIAEGSVDCSRA